VALAAPVAHMLGEGQDENASWGRGEDYYEYFIVDNDKEKLEYYEALGVILEYNGRKCVANPLVPDKCIAYTKRYEEDRFRFKPPAASPDFYSRCIRCGLCYFQCHYMGYNAIRLASLRDGLKAFGTPIIDDHIRHPCTLCMECTRVCPTGALERVLEEAKERARKKERKQGKETFDRTIIANYPDLVKKTRMGVALIDPDLCWAWNSGDCKSCAKACPFGAEVFDFLFTPWGVHTRVKAVVRDDGTIETKCVGCGLCVAACPVVGSAIHVLPEEEFVRRYRNFKNTGMSYEEYLKKILDVEDHDPFKAVLRAMEINNVFLLDIRGIKKEKIKTELAAERSLGESKTT